MERGRSRSTLVARAYLEYHVVLAELLHELLAVAHAPAQICARVRRGESQKVSTQTIARARGVVRVSRRAPFCSAWKSFASMASLS